MRFEKQEPEGGAVLKSKWNDDDSESMMKQFLPGSTSLPFGEAIAFADVQGSATYLTAQTLIQQVAYSLSDKIYSYSPETFDLDISIKNWAASRANNSYGYPTSILSMQTRTGAGSIALGYMFSKDFDLSKRHIPQSLLASASSLRHLSQALEQLSLLYSVANPFVAHVAAVDYAPGSKSLVTDYTSALIAAEELGLGLVCSSSSFEVQHMSIFSTLLAKILPTIHIYDGVKVGRETIRMMDVLSDNEVADVYNTVVKEIPKPGRKSPVEDCFAQLLQAFNAKLGTNYAPFEYHGHKSPEAVLVVFGTVEASLASQLATELSKRGVKIGVVTVRVYRPFLEDEFLAVLPNSTQTISVLGQVQSRHAVTDKAIKSILFGDVLASLAFSNKWSSTPKAIDLKYARDESFIPASMVAIFSQMLSQPVDPEESANILSPDGIEEYAFWDLDDSSSILAPIAIAKLISTEPNSYVSLKDTHDNLVQGGTTRTDIRVCDKSVDSLYPVENASITVVGDARLLADIAIIKNIARGSSLIIKLPGIKDDELEKKLSAIDRRDIHDRKIQLYILDPSLSAAVEKDATLESLLLELAFVRVVGGELLPNLMEKLATINGTVTTLIELLADLDQALRLVDVPATWAEGEFDTKAPELPPTIKSSSFVGFDRVEAEPTYLLKNWQTAAKGLLFKEAYETKTALRPDLSVKTRTIRVKENRRLTPLTYDRNIFHIEFDIGTSGLKYEIGEALGIHAENDKQDVNTFIQFYGLDPDQTVEVPSRESPDIMETRTVYQSLVQNIDLFGRPPKRFYEELAEFASDENEKNELLTLGSPEGAAEFKRRSEVDTVTYADILLEFKSAHPGFHDIARIVSPMKRREYSIASSQKVDPTTIALMIVVVNWVDSKGRDRFGQATRYLSELPIGTAVTVSIKPSVMKLPAKDTAPLIMAGLGTGLAPFRAFVQYRAMQKAQGIDIGAILLYMGSRHQREEYLYGEEWEAYQDAGVITLLGRAFSRDQPQKIYIQDRMRQTMSEIIQAYIKDEGSFYLCGPTWPVPDVTEVLQEAIAREAQLQGKRADPRKEIDRLKDDLRYVLEVY